MAIIIAPSGPNSHKPIKNAITPPNPIAPQFMLTAILVPLSAYTPALIKSRHSYRSRIIFDDSRNDLMQIEFLTTGTMRYDGLHISDIWIGVPPEGLRVKASLDVRKVPTGKAGQFQQVLTSLCVRRLGRRFPLEIRSTLPMRVLDRQPKVALARFFDRSGWKEGLRR